MSQAAWRCHTGRLTFFFFFSQCKNQGHPVHGAASRGRAKGGAASFVAWAILGIPHHGVLQMLKSYPSSVKPEKFTD